MKVKATWRKKKRRAGLDGRKKFLPALKKSRRRKKGEEKNLAEEVQEEEVETQ